MTVSNCPGLRELSVLVFLSKRKTAVTITDTCNTQRVPHIGSEARSPAHKIQITEQFKHFNFDSIFISCTSEYSQNTDKSFINLFADH